MSNKWQIVLLGVVVAQGVCLNASENKTNSPKTPRRNELSYSGGYASGGCAKEYSKEPEIMKAYKDKQYEKELNKLQVERKPSSGNLNKKESKEEKKSVESKLQDQLREESRIALRNTVFDYPHYTSKAFYLYNGNAIKYTGSQHSDCP